MTTDRKQPLCPNMVAMAQAVSPTVPDVLPRKLTSRLTLEKYHQPISNLTFLS